MLGLCFWVRHLGSSVEQNTELLFAVSSLAGSKHVVSDINGAYFASSADPLAGSLQADQLSSRKRKLAGPNIHSDPNL